MNETFLEVKSRWVSRGFEQEDADIIFYAATPFPAELKILLVLALIFDWEVIIADAESAFLQTPMTEEVYMWPPPEAGEPPGMCWRMLQIIQGLRGGPRGWGEYASDILALGKAWI